MAWLIGTTAKSRRIQRGQRHFSQFQTERVSATRDVPEWPGHNDRPPSRDPSLFVMMLVMMLVMCCSDAYDAYDVCYDAGFVSSVFVSVLMMTSNPHARDSTPQRPRGHREQGEKSRHALGSLDLVKSQEGSWRLGRLILYCIYYFTKQCSRNEL